MSEPFVTVVIASRGNAQGLWYSINSAEWELQQAGVDFKVSIVTNGGGKIDSDTKQVIGMLKLKSDYLVYHKHHEEALTPQQARQEAIDNSDSKYIFCADNHVLFCPGFFKRFFYDWEKCNASVLHSATSYYAGKDHVLFGYKLQLKKDFWGSSELFTANPYIPFKIAAGGHGGVGFRRDDFKKYGGYYLSSSCSGYGSEEVSCDLSVWLQGGEVWQSPQSIHKHWAATTRGYGRHHTEDYYKNMFSCAYILANETADNYVYSMMEHFKACSKPYLKKPMFDILMEAKERSVPYAAWLKERRLRTLEEQLEYFVQNEIAHK